MLKEIFDTIRLVSLHTPDPLNVRRVLAVYIDTPMDRFYTLDLVPLRPSEKPANKPERWWQDKAGERIIILDDHAVTKSLDLLCCKRGYIGLKQLAG